VGVKLELIAMKYYRLAGGCVPVNLERLCCGLGLAIVEWFGPPDFTSLLSVPHRIIVVNRNMRYVRRRFSVAHELGHYALGQAGVQFFGERGRAERAANAFAAKLLMPKPVIVSICGQLNRNCEPVRRWPDFIAFRLGVSAQAARVRLEECRIVENRDIS
jgi:Zn-dependent peptidase ImmA (M78 family)